MTIMKLTFAGTIMKAEHKQAGDKAICEVSLCKKHKGKKGAEDAFTWIRVTIWEPADFQSAKLVKGSMIAGTGDIQLRSFEHKGEKRQSLEVRCTSYDVDVSGGTEQAPAARELPPSAAAAVAREKAQIAASNGGDDEPPF